MAEHAEALLTVDEITQVVDLLKAKGKVGDDTTFRRVSVAHPNGFKDRRIEAWLYHAKEREIEELMVSLTNNDLVSERTVTGEIPQYGFGEIAQMLDVVRSDPAVIEALKKRGIDDPSKIQVDAWPTGNMGLDHEVGRRVARGVLFYRETQSDNGYAKPVDGLTAFVDLDEMKVYRVDDVGEWPVPAELNNYHHGTVPDRTDLKTIDITQPDGPSFTVTDGNHIRWANWDVRAVMDHTEGLVLQSLAWTDGGTRRPIMRRASLSEMVVPYGETRTTQAFKNALDVGEIGLGRTVNSLTLGCDCLGDITYLDSAWCFDDGTPIGIEQSICIHEEDFGILWKHTDAANDGAADVRRSRRLVISSIFTVGNYDYGIFWYLYLDGTIQLEIKLTGIVTTQAHKPGDSLDYAAQVGAEVAAPIHQHLFCARFDMEVDGPSNTAYRVDVEADPQGPDNLFGNAFRAVPTRLETEQQAIDVVDATKARTWRVVNEGATNGFGNPTGYKLLPADTATLFSTGARIAGRAGFAKQNLWVTPSSLDERFPAGDHVTQSEPDDRGLPTWTAADRPIADTDIVVWHTFGLTHAARPEDFPVMPTEYARCTWVPFGFFDKNPALDIPPGTHCH